MNDARTEVHDRSQVPHQWIDVADERRTRTEARRRSARLLIIDDHLPNLTLLRSVLTRAGFGEITAVEDPREATEVVEVRPPDVILLDYHMPHLDGLDVVSQLQGAVPTDIYLPIVMITSDEDVRLHRAAMRMGVTEVRIKPLDHELLTLTVDRLLETRDRILSAGPVDESAAEAHVAQDAATALNQIVRLHQVTSLRDHALSGRGTRVARIASEIAEHLGWTPARSRALQQAARVYDVGMLALPDPLLDADRQLTAEEHVRLRTHPALGQALLENVPGTLGETARHAARSHHERWDGRGYPDRLAGEAIPIEARIVAVADTFDTLAHQRPYQAPRSEEAAYKVILEDAGSAFDPEVVAAFRSWFQQGTDDDLAPSETLDGSVIFIND